MLMNLLNWTSADPICIFAAEFAWTIIWIGSMLLKYSAKASANDWNVCVKTKVKETFIYCEIDEDDTLKSLYHRDNIA